MRDRHRVVVVGERREQAGALRSRRKVRICPERVIRLIGAITVAGAPVRRCAGAPVRRCAGAPLRPTATGERAGAEGPRGEKLSMAETGT
jgi:hypothetical protein